MLTTMRKSDAQLKEDLIAELKWDPRVEETDIGVQVNDGIVTLAGTVSALSRKIAAREAAHRVSGVLDVVDKVTVRADGPHRMTDEDTARAVRNALRWDALVPDDRISSTVSEGRVTLDGDVETWAQRQDAERVVQRLTGVRSVVNQIKVRARPADSLRIKQEIEAALERQALREARRIGVTVQNGVVTLTGTVHSWGEKNIIDRVAGFAPGVVRIDDRTTVDPYA